MPKEAKTLSQAEIDALLTAVPAEGTSVQVTQRPVKARNVKGYDFRRPDKFSKEHIRTLQVLHQTFARLISNSLSSRLRTMTTIKLSSIDQVLYEEYIQLVPTPTVLHIIGMEPLPGSMLFEYSTSMGLLLVDRLLGGGGRPYDEPHEITDLEMALIGKFANSFQELLTTAWENVVALTPKLMGTELSAQFVQIAAPGDVVIMVLYEVQIGDQLGAMSLCLPYTTLEPALPKLTTQGWFVSSSRASGGDAERDSLRKQLQRVELDVSALLGSTNVTAGELVALQPGDVLRLDNLATREVPVRVGSRLKYQGLPGLAGNRVAVKITAVNSGMED